ncbi:hypothetical protein [Tunturiibacter lichenicola]|jgi:hypothetical protein|uniref:hypothetical protein n=1 Tax=Tunturiibacter lichenicola TaxID=2051959 RepID=UPI003D9B16EC
MRRVVIALAFCFCSLAMHGQKMRAGQTLPHVKPGDSYPVKMHISGIRYRRKDTGPGETADLVYMDAVINGKKLELRGDRDAPFQYYKLALGDCQARLVKDPHEMGDTPIFQVYDVVLPDSTVGRFTVTGISE